MSIDRAVHLAVNGTLMRGLELNPNMINAGATFVREAVTVPAYRIWSIDDRHPAMMRTPGEGTSVAVEIWNVPAEAVATILLAEPPGLAIGKVVLRGMSASQREARLHVIRVGGKRAPGLHFRFLIAALIHMERR